MIQGPSAEAILKNLKNGYEAIGREEPDAKVVSDTLNSIAMQEMERLASEKGMVALPMVLYSDGTRLTSFKNKCANPVYLSILSLPKELRRSVSGKRLLGFLGTGTRDDKVAALKAIMARISAHSEAGVLMAIGYPDPEPVRMLPFIAAYRGDLAELAVLTGVIESQHPRLCPTGAFRLRDTETLGRATALFSPSCRGLFPLGPAAALISDRLHLQWLGIEKSVVEMMKSVWKADEIAKAMSGVKPVVWEGRTLRPFHPSELVGGRTEGITFRRIFLWLAMFTQFVDDVTLRRLMDSFFAVYCELLIRTEVQPSFSEFDVVNIQRLSRSSATAYRRLVERYNVIEGEGKKERTRKTAGLCLLGLDVVVFGNATEGSNSDWEAAHSTLVKSSYARVKKGRQGLLNAILDRATIASTVFASLLDPPAGEGHADDFLPSTTTMDIADMDPAQVEDVRDRRRVHGIFLHGYPHQVWIGCARQQTPTHIHVVWLRPAVSGGSVKRRGIWVELCIDTDDAPLVISKGNVLFDVPCVDIAGKIFAAIGLPSC
jgi:hypothetical protein